MTDILLEILPIIWAWAMGIVLGYVLWGPWTPWKAGFVDGLSLKFLWKKKKS